MPDAIVAAERDTRILRDGGRRGARAISKGCETDECWMKVAGKTMKIVHGTNENARNVERRKEV